MNFLICLSKIFSQDITHEEGVVLWAVVERVGWRVLLVLFIVFSFGGFSLLGIEGFARAGQLEGIQKDMAAVKDTLIKKREQELPSLILDATERWCTASGDAKRLRLDALNILREEYFVLMKREFDHPLCSDLH